MARGPPECGSTGMSPNKPTSGDAHGDMTGCGGRSDEFDLSSHPAESKTSCSVVTYNCEGLMSALPFVGDLLIKHDIVFLAETWISRSEQHYLPSHLNTSCSIDCFIIQEFAMDFPPGAGDGRRHGGVAMICCNRPDLRYDRVQCDDERLCGVTVSDCQGPRLTILGC